MTKVVYHILGRTLVWTSHYTALLCPYLKLNVLIIDWKTYFPMWHFRVVCVDHTGKHFIWILFNIVDLRVLILWRSLANSGKMNLSTTVVAFSGHIWCRLWGVTYLSQVERRGSFARHIWNWRTSCAVAVLLTPKLFNWLFWLYICLEPSVKLNHFLLAVWSTSYHK